MFFAKQTWAKDKSYSGLETDLNLTYYEDKTGQRYQRTPEEQAVIIEGINNYFNYRGEHWDQIVITQTERKSKFRFSFKYRI